MLTPDLETRTDEQLENMERRLRIIQNTAYMAEHSLSEIRRLRDVDGDYRAIRDLEYAYYEWMDELRTAVMPA